jgi:hypothetical protein
MISPWFDQDKFYISEPGIILPCCHHGSLYSLKKEDRLYFYEHYSKLFITNDNTVEYILNNYKYLIRERIMDLKKSLFCDRCCGG